MTSKIGTPIIKYECADTMGFHWKKEISPIIYQAMLFFRETCSFNIVTQLCCFCLLQYYLSASHGKTLVNMNDFPGILYARTADGLATLLGIAHLLLPVITVTFQATSQQNALLKLFAGTARSLDTLLVNARMRPCAIPAIRQVIWHVIAPVQDLMLSYATTALSQAILLLTAPMTGPATTAVSLGT